MNAPQKLKSTTSGIELVRYLASRGSRIFSMEQAREVAPNVGVTASYLPEALYHLRRNGWIALLHRGLYAISSSVLGVAPTHEFEIAMALVDPAAISHWSALHYHELTEQAPRRVFVLTTTTSSIPRKRGVRPTGIGQGYPLGDFVYQFVRVKPERFFGTQKVWIGDARVTITDAERTLLDGLAMPRYCGDFAEVLHAFELKRPDLNLDRIVGYALRLDATTAKRVGWVLEKQGVEPAKLEALLQVPIKGYQRLDPTGPRRGPCNRRWMIQENLPGKVKQ